MRPGPAPKDPGARVRRNVSTVPARHSLPAGGYGGPIPAWPLTENPASAAELERWARLWRTPQAAAWAGCALEVGLAVMVQLEIRCQRPRASAQHFGELRHARAEFGLSLDSMAKLGLHIEAADDHGTTAPTPSPRRRLKAVDPDVT